MNKISLLFFIVLFQTCLIFIARGQDYGDTGKRIYEKKCVACHGKDGTKGALGAKNLQVSRLDDSSLFVTISEGRNRMPSWKKKLTSQDVNHVIRYIKSLRSLNTQQ